ncbi:MAG TPA: polyphosphate kinase 2 family protein [Acidobacteriota bacterium]
MKFSKEFAVKPGKTVKLSRYDPDYTAGFKDKSEAEELLQKKIARLDELQNLLFAERKHALLVVLQAMDSGGKDGTIRRVMSGVNPQGCEVTSFKAPSAEEASHDFLWRVHHAVPARGEIGIFNRSHYEDVLVVRVHHLVPRPVWSRRYEQINAFEQILAENGVKILKFFLHISKDEQKKRLRERIEVPEKNWKVNPGDFDERKLWNQYMEAYQDALSRCSTERAPWFVIPANKKWLRNLAVSAIIVEALESLDMKFPAPPCDLSKLILK